IIVGIEDEAADQLANVAALIGAKLVERGVLGGDLIGRRGHVLARVRRRLVGAAGLVGQRRVLKLQREFTVAVGLIGVGDHRLPAGRAAVLPGAAVGVLAAGELDAGMLGVPPLAVLGLDQQAERK